MRQNLGPSVCLSPVVLPTARPRPRRAREVKMESQHNHRNQFCLPTILLRPRLIGRTCTQSSRWIWPSSDVALTLARQHRWRSHPCRHRRPLPLHVLYDPSESCGCLPPLSLLPNYARCAAADLPVCVEPRTPNLLPAALSPIAAIPPTGAHAYACALAIWGDGGRWLVYQQARACALACQGGRGDGLPASWSAPPRSCGSGGRPAYLYHGRGRG